MTDTNPTTTPLLVTPTIYKPAVGSSSSASIRRPNQPPTGIASPLSFSSSSPSPSPSINGPASQPPQNSGPPKATTVDSSSIDPSTTNSGTEETNVNPPPSNSSHPSTENEEENESEWTSEHTHSSAEDQDDHEADMPIETPEENEDPSKTRVWALVKFSYDTDDSEELPLQLDEVIEILEQSDDGWWKGKNVFGKVGIFPHNLVTLTDDPSSVKTSPHVPASPISALPTSIGDTSQSTPPSLSSSPALALKKARHSILPLPNVGKKKKSKDEDTHSIPSTPPPYPLSPTGSSPSRKNSHDKNKKDRRSQTIANGFSPVSQLTKSNSSKIVSSPSMPSLPILSNKASRSPSQSSLQYPSAIRTSDSNVPPPQPSSLSTNTPTPSSAFTSPFPTNAPSSPQVTPSPAPTPANTPAPSAAPTPASGAVPSTPDSPNPSPRSTTPTPTAPESFIMKIHVPPSGSSQFKVQPNQTVGDLIAMVAKKRMVAAKDCSMRVPSAPLTDPPLETSTSISSLGIRELRLFVAGESASALRPISSGASSSNNLLANNTNSTYAPAASGRMIKEGYMQKADNNKKMKKTWVTLDKNFVYFYKTALDKNPTERISLYCATPKISTEPKKKNYFDLVTVTNTFSFAAENESEAVLWVNAMQEACQALIMKQIGANNSEPAAPVAERKDQRAKELLQQIRDLPDNNICAECSATRPDWAAINLGIFFCIDCSGIHRSMGVHISQVRSVSLDHWDLSQIMIMETMGNKRANEFWEHTIPSDYHKPTPKSTAEEREEWIRAKYQQKQFIDNGIKPPSYQAPAPTPTSNGTPILSSVVESPSTPPPSRPGRTNTPPLNSALAALIPAEASASAVPSPSPTPSPVLTSVPAPAPTPVPAAISSPVLSASNTTPPQSANGSPVLSHVSSSSAASSVQGTQKLPGMDFVGYGFLSYQDETRPVLKRLIKLFKNTFDENRTVHVAAQNAPSGAWRDVEYQVVDQLSVDTSSVRGYIPMSTKVFEKIEDLNKFLSTHLQPQLDSYRQTVLLQSESSKQAADSEKWHVIVEVRMELYEIYVDQLDEEGLSPHVVKAAPHLSEGDPAFLYQFIKKTGTHFVRSAVYGGRYLMKTKVEKSQVPDKDEAIRLCQQQFRSLFEGEPAPQGVEKVSNYTIEITGGDNRKRGIEWIASIWDRPQVLSYDIESISAVFDDLSISVKVDAAATEFLAKLKNP